VADIFRRRLVSEVVPAMERNSSTVRAGLTAGSWWSDTAFPESLSKLINRGSGRRASSRIWEFFPNFDLHPDGKRFAVLKAPGAESQSVGNNKVNFIFNFFEELRRKVPSGKN